MIRVALRLDDPSETSDHALEKTITGELAQLGMRATFAVIPFKVVAGNLVPFSPERASHLVEAEREGIVEIAMHGFSHTDRRRRPDGPPSEFRGVSEMEQVNMLQRGLAHMHTLFAEKQYGFVPPWNSFDKGTLQALAHLGFGYVSAGWEVECDRDTRMAILPRTCHLPDARQAVEEARRYRHLSPMVIVVMHHDDFAESGAETPISSLEEFQQLLAWFGAQTDVVVQPLRQLAAGLTARECMRAIRTHEIRQGLHWRMQSHLPARCFVPVPLWRAILKR